MDNNRNITTGELIPARFWFAEDGSNMVENEPHKPFVNNTTWETCGRKKRAKGFALSLGYGIMPCDRELYCKYCQKPTRR